VLLGRKPYIKWNISKEDIEIVNKAVKTLGLEDYSLRYLDELSGGELQKVVMNFILKCQKSMEDLKR
jgi:iron complex transport system ATP-binding protein